MSPEPLPVAASLSIPANIIQKNFREKSQVGHVSFHRTTEAMKYTCTVMFLARPIDEPFGEINDMYRENPAKIPVWQEIRQSIPQLI